MHTTAVPAVHGSIPQTLPCIGVLYYVRTDICVSFYLLSCLSLWYWYTVVSVLCALVASFMAFVMPACQTHTLGWAVEFTHMSFLHRKSLTCSAPSCWHCPPPSPLCDLPPPQRGGGGMWSKAPLLQLDRGQASCSAAGVNSH